jgi:methanol--5-hydroxybenzimidazolylcobamide Co-methyltransferase
MWIRKYSNGTGRKKYIPKTFAAIARIATIVKTLVSVEEGAKGPDKDCGYEGPYIMAITGIPISMEGKTAACAHLSPLENITAACCDLWSNKSLQNIKLLAGHAPTVYMEQLEYDTKLMNQAIKEGEESILNLQRLFVNSDRFFDPQALILDAKVVIEISKEIVKGENCIDACKKACLKALIIIQESIKKGQIIHDPKEDMWIELLKTEIASITTNESQFIEEITPTIDSSKVILSGYGI